MKRNRNTKKIIISVTVAFLAMFLSYAGFSSKNKMIEQQKDMIAQMQQKAGGENGDNISTYTYAVATKSLKAGEIVSDSDVDFKSFDTKQDNAFEDRSDVINKVLLRDIEAGSTFTSSHIAKVSSDDVTLRPGYRALTLPSDGFQGRSNKMLMGSVVDIYSASSDNPWKLEDVRIVAFENDLSTDSATTSDSGSTDKKPSSAQQDAAHSTAITFEVPANAIADFISSASKSKLVLVARNPNERVPKNTYHPSSSYSAMSYPAPSYSNYSPKSSKHSYSGSSKYSALPNLPSAVPIKNFGSGSTGLPQPIKPYVHPSASVEMIQANVKSKVTFN